VSPPSTAGLNRCAAIDGLSNSAMMSEVLAGKRDSGTDSTSVDHRGVWCGISVSSYYEHRDQPNTVNPDISGGCDNTMIIPCQRGQNTCHDSAIYHARSRHTTGVKDLSAKHDSWAKKVGVQPWDEVNKGKKKGN